MKTVTGCRTHRQKRHRTGQTDGETNKGSDLYKETKKEKCKKCNGLVDRDGGKGKGKGDRELDRGGEKGRKERQLDREVWAWTSHEAAGERNKGRNDRDREQDRGTARGNRSRRRGGRSTGAEGEKEKV